MVLSVEAILQSVAAARSSGKGVEPVMKILSEGLQQHKTSEVRGTVCASLISHEVLMDGH